MSNVFLYLPKLKSIATPVIDFAERMNIYTLALERISPTPGSVFTLITTTPIPKLATKKKFVWLTVSPIPLIRFWQARKRIVQSPGNKTLISGNNHLALIASLLLRLTIANLKIQTSIHAELVAIEEDKSFKGRVKFWLMLKLIPRVDSLRLVTSRDVDKASTLFKLPRSQILVAPVPVLISGELINKQKTEFPSLGFVGRIHEERGVSEWTKIALAAKSKIPELKVKVIGDGPERSYLEKALSAISTSVKFYGFVPQAELIKLWPEISVLLVSAPKESYGMATREALASGTLVLAKRNGANEDLKSIAPELVTLYDDEESAIKLLTEMLSRPINPSQVNEFRKNFAGQQRDYLDLLAKSWL